MIARVHLELKHIVFLFLGCKCFYRQPSASVALNPGFLFWIFPPKLWDKIRNGKPGFKASASD